MKNVTQNGTFEERSTWVKPVEGTPAYVSDGKLLPSHFAGKPFVQAWGKNSAFCDHIIDSQGFVLAGSYIKPVPIIGSPGSPPTAWNLMQPFVYRTLSDAPTIPDSSKPGGRAVWPAPGFQMKNLTNVEVDLHLFGDFPSEALNMTDCTDCYAKVYLYGSAGFFWKMKGMVTVERGERNAVDVLCGESRSGTVVRTLYSHSPTVTVHSGVRARKENFDTGGIMGVVRYNQNGVTKWGAGGGGFDFQANVENSMVAVLMGNNFNLPHEYADVMLDDWYPGAITTAKNSAYICGPNNQVTAPEIVVDTRFGWQNHMDCPYRNLKGNILNGNVRTI